MWCDLVTFSSFHRTLPALPPNRCISAVRPEHPVSRSCLGGHPTAVGFVSRLPNTTFLRVLQFIRANDSCARYRHRLSSVGTADIRLTACRRWQYIFYRHRGLLLQTSRQETPANSRSIMLRVRTAVYNLYVGHKSSRCDSGGGKGRL